MARDRTAADTFHLAHEHFARTLGVSRSNITSATGALKKKRLIHCERKSITICNHARLEAIACECYQVLRQASHTSLPAPALSKPEKVRR